MARLLSTRNFAKYAGMKLQVILSRASKSVMP